MYIKKTAPFIPSNGCVDRYIYFHHNIQLLEILLDDYHPPFWITYSFFNTEAVVYVNVILCRALLV